MQRDKGLYAARYLIRRIYEKHLGKDVDERSQRTEEMSQEGFGLIQTQQL